ncbi:hypothetical protein K488DRAFT_85226 [Vararia minispora EC-137]|uniref:Uncharacterized protein n=1 Tax=Vararia minispora EC-137 TaxID=1314806 RepID=A0ACB8QN23_9AGAM|nr:hypothetical protein K488DRAFT_85226 [Vararia minispora EC-137]
MFSSLFSTTDPTAQNFHPVSSAFKPEELNGALEPKDTEHSQHATQPEYCMLPLVIMCVGYAESGLIAR